LDTFEKQSRKNRRKETAAIETDLDKKVTETQPIIDG
jgi:hypothetical protein